MTATLTGHAVDFAWACVVLAPANLILLVTITTHRPARRLLRRRADRRAWERDVVALTAELEKVQ